MINYNLKFLSFDANIPDTDLKASKCETKKRHEENVRDVAKRSYFKKRGCGVRPPKSRLLREFVGLFREKSAIFCEWLSDTTVVVVFSSGVIAYLSVDPASLDITQILFDRYCVGKLSSQAVCGVVFSSSHLLFTHAEGTVTLITFGASKSEDHNVPYKIADRNPHLLTTELVDNARRSERRLSWSEPPPTAKGRGPRVLVWSAAHNEPAPWTPVTDLRANLHLYHLNGSHMNLVAYHQLENETILAEILRNDYNVIHIVDQVICQKNGVMVEWARYEVAPCEEGAVRLGAHGAGGRRGQRARLAAGARAAALCARGERLLLAALDGTLHVLHRAAGHTHSATTAFIGSAVRWAGRAGCALLCGSEAARLQCFDAALQPLPAASALLHRYREDAHFNILAVRSITNGALLLTSFNSDSIALLKLSHPKLPMAWVRWGKLDRAVAVLQTMNWDLDGDECLFILQAIIKEALRAPLTASRSAAVRTALGTYLSEPRASPRPALLDLARLYHHHLLRRGRISEALSLGVEVGAWDLFVDARWRAAAAAAADPALAAEAALLALHAPHHPRAPESECSGTCSCSESSCSSSEGEASSNSNENKPLPPPLPRIPYPTTAQPIRAPGPVNQSEPSTNSIRPNLNQYLERDLTTWNTDVRTEEPTVRWHSMDDVLDPKINPRSRALKTIKEKPHRRKSSVVEIASRNFEPILSYTSVYQRDLRNEPSSSARYQNGLPQLPQVDRTSRQVEKNVKFSDTVTVAVVPESIRRIPEPAQELADSLPLCPPHAYLAAFEPHPHPHHRADTGIQYFEV